MRVSLNLILSNAESIIDEVAELNVKLSEQEFLISTFKSFLKKENMLSEYNNYLLKVTLENKNLETVYQLI